MCYRFSEQSATTFLLQSIDLLDKEVFIIGHVKMVVLVALT